MTTDTSPIIEYYPIEFEQDLNGKLQAWEAVVLIPFIDEVSFQLRCDKNDNFLIHRQASVMLIYDHIEVRDSTLYELKFSRWFYFREFRESNPRENFHFNLCLFIVMTTSAKSRN